MLRTYLGLQSVFAAIILSWLLYLGWSLDIYICSILISVHLFISLIFSPANQGSTLSRLYLFLFTLPFLHIFEYVNFDFNPNTPFIVGGLLANPYTLDSHVMERTFNLGLIGQLALASGVFLIPPKSEPQKYSSILLLKKRSFALIILAAILFSWVYAPINDIFMSRYTESASLLQKLKISFNASWLLSYVLMTLAFSDLLREKNKKDKMFKLILFVASLLLIVIYFQFLRGDRECMGLIAALAVLSSIALVPNNLKQVSRRKILLLLSGGGALLLLVVLAQLVGVIRSTAIDQNLSILPKSIPIAGGTWSASLLTPVSVVGDFYYNLKEPVHGSTYWDYILSTPPSFFSQAIGYTRPIDTTTGNIAWLMRYGIGGVHAIVAPYLNFGILGVLAAFFFIGLFIGLIEKSAKIHHSLLTYTLVGTMATVAPHWIWYGDMNLIRALMSFVLVMGLFYLLPKNRLKA